MTLHCGVLVTAKALWGHWDSFPCFFLRTALGVPSSGAHRGVAGPVCVWDGSFVVAEVAADEHATMRKST